jgi:hypothetical protein
MQNFIYQWFTPEPNRFVISRSAVQFRPSAPVKSMTYEHRLPSILPVGSSMGSVFDKIDAGKKTGVKGRRR